MRLRLLLVTALLLIGCSSTASAAPPHHQLGDEYLDDAIDVLGASGGGWAVIDGGEITHRGVSGTDGNGAPVTADTPFLLGSVSKPVLASLVVDQIDAGAGSLDDPVARTLPGLAEVDGADTITVEQLLDHTSGLPFGADLLDADDPARRAADVTEQLEGIELRSPPGQAYEYSSLGYLVLTAWLEETTGQPLSVLDDRGWTVPAQDVAPGRRGALLPPQSPPRDGAGAGYGYSASTLDALAGFAADSLRDRDRLTSMTDVDPASGETLTGLGWRVTGDEEGDHVWHTGTVPGYFTAVHLLPDQDLGIVFWVNRSGYLDEQRLYDASTGLLHIASGDRAELPGPAVTRWLAIAGALIAATVAVVLARVGRRGALGAAIGLCIMLLAGPVLAVRLMGMPLRYLALWLPDLTLALVALGIAAMVAVLIRGGRTPVR